MSFKRKSRELLLKYVLLLSSLIYVYNYFIQCLQKRRFVHIGNTCLLGWSENKIKIIIIMELVTRFIWILNESCFWCFKMNVRDFTFFWLMTQCLWFLLKFKFTNVINGLLCYAFFVLCIIQLIPIKIASYLLPP